MKHYTSSDFWKFYKNLPAEVQELADKNYELLKANPRHPSLQLKRIEELWSVRVGLHLAPSGSTHREAFSGSGLAAMLSTTSF